MQSCCGKNQLGGEHMGAVSPSSRPPEAFAASRRLQTTLAELQNFRAMKWRGKTCSAVAPAPLEVRRPLGIVLVPVSLSCF